MKKLIIAALVVANLGLLAGLMIGESPDAQASNAYYPATNYVMVAGRLESGLEILYVVDMASQKMAALKYDLNSNRLEGLGIRDLATDFRGRD